MTQRVTQLTSPANRQHAVWQRQVLVLAQITLEPARAGTILVPNTRHYDPETLKTV